MSLSRDMARGLRWTWRRHGIVSIGCVLVGLVVLAALGADVIAPHSPYDLDVARMLQPPSFAN